MAYPDQTWKARSTMTEPATASWDISISEADFGKLKAGVESTSMEERWDIWSEETSHNNNILIHYARSWTGDKIYILHVEPNDGGTGAKIIGVTWAQEMGEIRITEKQCKKDAIILTRALLHCKIEELPEYDFSDLYRPASTRAFEERQRCEQASGSENKAPR